MEEDNYILIMTMICKKFYDRVMHKVLQTHKSDTSNYINEDKSQTIEVKSVWIK